MSASRISLALEDGLVRFPAGGAVVWGARPGSDLATLPRDTVFVATFRPFHDALKAMGWRVVTAAPGAAELGIVYVPREKALAQAMIAEAAHVVRGPVVIDGAKTDGVESLLRALGREGTLSPAISKGHGKLAVLEPGASLDGWRDRGPAETVSGFATRPGVFSADGPDPASRVLAEALPKTLGPRVADLGAGWGFLSAAILGRDGVECVDLIEADLRALDCARANIDDPRAAFHWADATRFSYEPGFDAIVTNPPFHNGRAADPTLGQSFITAAARLLKPSGTLWLVANRHLPYEHVLGSAFGEVAEAGGDRGYKLFRAMKPRTWGALA